MAETIPDISRAARAARQAAWQAGWDWAGHERLVKAALGACDGLDDAGRYLFLIGVANALTSAARDLAGLDERGKVG